VVFKNRHDFGSLWLTGDLLSSASRNEPAWEVGWKTLLFLLALLIRSMRGGRPVYALDWKVFEAPASWKATHEELMTMMKAQKVFNKDSIDFMHRILGRSGMGQSTAWPPAMMQCLKTGKPMEASLEAARAESEAVICDVVERVLKSTKTRPQDIDILVINCSLFSPTPSLCAMVVQRFGMRPDVLTYNLSGMGCSAGIIAVDLATRLLRASFNSKAMVVSTENLTQNLYFGQERSMLLQNTLFRCGGAAVILSNKYRDGFRAKLKLLTTVRTQGMGKEAYECVYEGVDEKGNRGIKLSKGITKVAGRTMERNLTSLGPHVLPWTELAMVVFYLGLRKAVKVLRTGLGARKEKTDDPKSDTDKADKEAALRARYDAHGGSWSQSLAAALPHVKPYVPDFKRGIDHFCIHAGGRAVVDGIGQNLQLSPEMLAPSRHTLEHYGNTSSSSIWYEMDYIFKTRAKRGDRVLQLGFGSGFKCNSAVWLCLRPNRPYEEDE